MHVQTCARDKQTEKFSIFNMNTDFSHTRCTSGVFRKDENVSIYRINEHSNCGQTNIFLLHLSTDVLWQLKNTLTKKNIVSTISCTGFPTRLICIFMFSWIFVFINYSRQLKEEGSNDYTFCLLYD